MLLSSLCLLWVRPLHSPAPHGACQAPSSSPRQSASCHFPLSLRKRILAEWGNLYVHDSEAAKQSTDDHIFQERWERVYLFVEVKNTCVYVVWKYLIFHRLIYILSALSLDIWVGGPVSGGKAVLSTRSQRKDSQFLSQRLVVHRKSTVSKCIQSQYGTWGASKELWGWLSIWEFWAVRMKQNKKRPGFLLPGFSYTPSLWKQPTLSRFQAEKL